MARDIEDFLRKAAERRAQAQRAAQGGGQPQPAPQRQARPAPQRQQRQQSRPSQAVSAEVVAAEAVPRDISRLHAQQEQKASQEAQAAVAADIHEKFDHQLGRLSGSQDDNAVVDATIQVSPQDDFANQLVSMLRQPASLRAAIILKEVLERPSHRW